MKHEENVRLHRAEQWWKLHKISEKAGNILKDMTVSLLELIIVFGVILTMQFIMMQPSMYIEWATVNIAIFIVLIGMVFAFLVLSFIAYKLSDYALDQWAESLCTLETQ